MNDLNKSHNQPAAGQRVPMDKGKPYTCPELGRNPGIDDSRFEAYALPSRRGDRLFYPDGRVEDVK